MMDILLFTQPDCPKCPRLKEELLEKLRDSRDITVSEIDVSTDEGFFESIKYNVMRTPAIVIKDSGKQTTLSEIAGKI